MSNKVLILHGLGGSDFPHWQAQLAQDLIEENNIVSFPAFPNRDNPNLKQWQEFLKKEIKHFQPNIVVCHSLANVLWFHTCEKLDIKLDKLLLVAPVSKSRVVEAASSFYPYDAKKDLKAKSVKIIASTNDPYMNIEEVKELQEELEVEMEVLNSAGHINASSGFGKLAPAMKWIKEV